MTRTDTAAALAAFDAALAGAGSPAAIYAALETLALATIGAKLFTVMAADMDAGVSRRVHTSDPAHYPVAGEKPINRTRWFDIVHTERRPFVANTIAEIAEVFPDHALIGSLGCGSVVNLPVLVAGRFLGTVNLLHEEHFYTPERVARALAVLSLPGKAALLATR